MSELQKVRMPLKICGLKYEQEFAGGGSVENALIWGQRAVTSEEDVLGGGLGLPPGFESPEASTGAEFWHDWNALCANLASASEGDSVSFTKFFHPVPVRIVYEVRKVDVETLLTISSAEHQIAFGAGDYGPSSPVTVSETPPGDEDEYFYVGSIKEVVIPDPD